MFQDRLTFKHIGVLLESTETPFFPSVISFKRNRFPHFVDNAALYASDRLAKARHPIHYFDNKFQILYTLMHDIAINENIIKLP
jgi:hypothetical protein